MRIYRFDAGVGEAIDLFGSEGFVFSKVVLLHDGAKISCFHLSPNGKVGYHQAVTPQLFLVVNGQGWVRDETSAPIPIEAGRAAFWDADEWHEAGTDTGLTAIVIEGEEINPAELMPLCWTGSERQP